MERLINRSAGYLAQELNLTGDQEIVLAYAMRIFLSSITGIIVIILLAMAAGVLPYTLAAAVTAAVLRMFSGGAHAGSPLNCTVIAGVIFTALGLAGRHTFASLENYLPVLAPAVWLMSILVILKYAPADTPAKPITTKMQRGKLRFISLTLVFVWGLPVFFSLAGTLEIKENLIYASTLGLLWQTFSLTPYGYTLSSLLDKAFNVTKAFMKGGKLPCAK
jgi:accessory gene regulator B